MAARDELRKQVNEIWTQAISQLEEVKDAVIRNTGRIEGRMEADMLRLRSERDKLLNRLGEQTYKLANQGKLPVPAVVKRTVDRLNEVIDGIVAREGGAKKSKKKASKKKTAKKSKTTKKKASKKKASSRKSASTTA